MMRIYSIYDKKVGAFSTNLFCGQNDAVIIRSLKSSLQQKVNHPDLSFPEDKDLYLVGEIAEDTGVISNMKPDFILHMGSLLEVDK